MGGNYAKPAEIKSKYYPSYVQNDLPRMDGKTVAITGSTSGTGFICANALAGAGARVIMLNRPSARAEAAVKAVQEAVPGSDVRHVACDLMSFDSVRKAAQQLKSELSELDVLCNNAGIMATKDEATVDGCDTQMQTNHLSHYLLTAELWPLLEKAANGPKGEARVVNHSSGARNRGGDGKKPLDEKYLQKNGGNLGGDDLGWTPFSGARWTRYQQTKLANVVFTYALRDRAVAAKSKVKSLCAHPGLSATNLQVTTSQDGGMGEGFTNFLMSYMSQSGEDGTVPLLRCCADPSAKSGDFFGPAGLTGPTVLMPSEPEEAFCDEASRKMLWEVSAQITGAAFSF
eukprot:CAMPEP_0204526544 /NCGR_PEP_ID=MMETSP0661-20131031/8499_1 /ASSEMBLY_ACC=CAM_ASM_000606 /TAXON_ID=109239 /ORGANISM="Alexandrium margalefi, Strain AMGDE01CS-322" /LENGTH=343 /DNA_ID=CAMNT_0051532399 /DNA_START=80 /DNA_END=1111 /DNA_ORIENTATION=+